jgi:2'-5' RNA ligase
MRAFAVVAYPRLASADLSWIEAQRRKYEALSQHGLPPHVTLVFPTADHNRQTLTNHLREQVSGLAPVRFVFRSAMVMPQNAGEDHSCVFLVPDEGHAQLRRMHDQLYREPLNRSLRVDIPFVPHLTVGRSKNLVQAQAWAEQLNDSHFEIRGVIDTLSLVSLDGAPQTLLELPLPLS